MIDRPEYAAQDDEDTSFPWNLHDVSYSSTASWSGCRELVCSARHQATRQRSIGMPLTQGGLIDAGNSMIFESLSTRLSAPFGANAPFQPGRLNRRFSSRGTDV